MSLEMCVDCFNLRLNGTCKVAWISKTEMQIRSAAGYCDEYKTADVSGEKVAANRIGFKAGQDNFWITRIANNEGS